VLFPVRSAMIYATKSLAMTPGYSVLAIASTLCFQG